LQAADMLYLVEEIDLQHNIGIRFDWRLLEVRRRCEVLRFVQTREYFKLFFIFLTGRFEFYL